MNHDISALVKTTIETQIIQAFKDTPTMIDELVKAALNQEVDQYGSKPASYGDKMPYLTWLVGDTIRSVARGSIQAAVNERKPEIEAAVRKAVSADLLIDGLMQKILGALDEDYKINVQFANETEKKRY